MRLSAKQGGPLSGRKQTSAPGQEPSLVDRTLAVRLAPIASAYPLARLAWAAAPLTVPVGSSSGSGWSVSDALPAPRTGTDDALRNRRSLAWLQK